MVFPSGFVPFKIYTKNMGKPLGSSHGSDETSVGSAVSTLSAKRCKRRRAAWDPLDNHDENVHDIYIYIYWIIMVYNG